MAAIDLSEFADLPDTRDMDIVDAMLAEHERILVEADDLERLCRELVASGTFSRADFDYKVRFIRSYADAAHHRKEEDVLYSYMLDNLGQVAENLIRHGMLVDHDRGRACVKRMEDAAAAYEADPSVENRVELVSWAMEYVHLIRAHVQRENTVAYPFARRSIDSAVMAELTAKAQSYTPHA